MKPTYDELAKVLTGLSLDTENTYKALRVGNTPIISIGQWSRLNLAKETAARAIADIA